MTEHSLFVCPRNYANDTVSTAHIGTPAADVRHVISEAGARDAASACTQS